MIWGDENATTGYTWNFDDKSCGEGITLVSNRYLTKQHPRGMMGVGGKRYLTYLVTPKASGNCKISLTYEQPWNLAQNW